MRAAGARGRGCALLLAALLGAPAHAQDERETTVGLPARIAELVLPGAELEVAPRRAHDPLVLRITRVSPHGDAFRYDLEYWALEPGEYDLRAWLRRKDGTPADLGDVKLAPIEVRVSSVLPPGQVKPRVPPVAELPSFGGYRALVVASGVAWLVVLMLLLRGGRERAALAAEAVRPLTLAERLRPLVERALRGQLSRAERARLELGLVAFWRRKLGLDARRPADALALLHAHAEAGPLLRSLEDWLHRPAPPTEVDLAALLAPYRDLPPDALERALEGPAPSAR